MKLVMNVLAVVVLAAYAVMLGYIPLSEFLVKPTLTLWMWLVMEAIAVVLGVWLVYAFSWKSFWVWVGLVMVLHGMLKFGDVGRAFEIDSCLDRGGGWRSDNTCEL